MSSIVHNISNEFNNISGSMKLEDSIVSKFRVAKEICKNTARINSIDFSEDGKNLITSADDDTITLYDCEKGCHKRDLPSKKYGANLIRYTHAHNTALHTSTKENDTIRYLSLHDNKYLRYFTGHEKRVVTLCMSPSDDTFMSGSIDGTIRIWDLKVPTAIGKIQTTGDHPVANYDPEGLIFALGMNNEFIKLYDARSYEKGPFNTIKLPKPPGELQWRSLKFSPNGKQILLTTNLEQLHLLDAFSGQPLHTLKIGPELVKPLEHCCEATFSCDSQYVLCGSLEGAIHVWQANNGAKVTVLKPPKGISEPVQCVMFNPKYMLIASACNKMTFWIPNQDK